MLPPEIWRRYRKLDLTAIIASVLAWALLTGLINWPNSVSTFYLSLFLTAVFMSFIALLIRKIGAVMLFSILGALISLPINNLGGLGIYKIAALGVAGLVFETVFVLVRLEFKSIPIDLILASALSFFSIPFTMALFVPSTKGLVPYLWNFALSALLIGVMGAVAAFLIWYRIKGLHAVIKFEYEV